MKGDRSHNFKTLNTIGKGRGKKSGGRDRCASVVKRRNNDNKIGPVAESSAPL